MRISESQYRQFIGNYTKQNKYHNKKVEYDGIKFDSVKEKNRYIGLKQLEKLGVIQNLQRQVKYELQPSFKLNGKTIRSITYIADFVYIQDGVEVIEDVKGMRTKEYLLKKKLFEYKYQKEIKEI
jgi:hypothetical protein